MSSATTNVSEYNVIASVVQQYIDGARSGKGEDMRSAFHKDATIFGYVGPDLFAGPIQQLFDWNDENGPATGQAQIASIDLIDVSVRTNDFRAPKRILTDQSSTSVQVSSGSYASIPLNWPMSF